VPDDATVRTLQGDDHDVVLLSGPLSLFTARPARVAVSKALAQRGRVLVDVSGLVLEWEPVITVFTTALSAAGGWPVARMALYGPPEPLLAALRRARVQDSVPVAADADTAARLLDVRPARVSRHRDLPAKLAAAQAARTYVGDTCAEWEVPEEITGAAIQVVSELVTNAVQHAHTSCRLTVALDSASLRVAVRDYGSPDRLVPLPPALCYGLQMVEVLSAAWGVTAHADGKTVWAVLPSGLG
jgi:hypothetical protein